MTPTRAFVALVAVALIGATLGVLCTPIRRLR